MRPVSKLARFFLLGLLACGLAAGRDAAAQAGDNRPAVTRVRFATLTTPAATLAPFAIASEQGLFVKNGVDVEFVSVDATPAALAAVASGAVQFGFTGTNIVDAVAAGVPVVAVYALTNLPVGQVCAINAIRTPQDLIGKAVALNNRGSAPDVTFRIWLQSQGLNDRQVTIRNIDIGSAAVVAAAVSGSVQAFSLPPPRCFLNAANGFHSIANLSSAGFQLFSAGVATNRAYLAANRDTVRGVLRALVEAHRLFKDNREIALRALGDTEKLTDPVALDALWDFFKGHFADPPYVAEAAISQAVRSSLNAKTAELGPGLVGRIFDNSVLEEIVGK